jgi:oligopeptide transport system substrate-binding protein
MRFLTCFFLLLLSACSKKEAPHTRQELRMNMKSEPLSLDPRKPYDVSSNNFLKMCFDGLTREGLDGTPHLSVAQAIEVSPDQKTYTITLKETYWSDGQPVTAQDFVASWKAQLDPTFPSQAAHLLYVLKNARAAKLGKCGSDAIGVAALDERTLRIELSYPNPVFLSMLASFSFFPVPAHIVESFPVWADRASSRYVTNGPFLLKEWHPSNRMRLEKNPNYWDQEAVKLQTLDFAILDDENTELSLYDSGAFDWSGSPLSTLPTDALPVLKKVHTYPIAGTYYYVFNTQDPLLKNSNLRRALSLAVNRQSIVENITQGGQQPALRYIPQALCSEEISYFQDADIEGAKACLKKALEELRLDKLPVLTLSYNTLQTHHLIAQAIQQQWQSALGIRVKLENKEWKVYLDEIQRGQFQITRMGAIAPNQDPLQYLNDMRYLSSSSNFCKWTNPQYTEWLEQAEQERDPQVRMQLLLKAEALFMEEMPVMPIYFYTGSYLKKDYVKNVYTSVLLDVDFKWAYLE